MEIFLTNLPLAFSSTKHRRIRRALNEAKAQANNVKKTIGSVASSTAGVVTSSGSSSTSQPDGRRHAQMMANNGTSAAARVAPTHPAYDQFGWGSDFDDDDDDEDDTENDDDDDQFGHNEQDNSDRSAAPHKMNTSDEGDSCNAERNNSLHDDNNSAQLARSTTLSTSSISQPPSKVHIVTHPAQYSICHTFQLSFLLSNCAIFH